MMNRMMDFWAVLGLPRTVGNRFPSFTNQE